MLLRFAPCLELGPVHRVKVGRLDLMPFFHELQVGQIRAAVLEVEGGVDAGRLRRQAGVAEIAH